MHGPVARIIILCFVFLLMLLSARFMVFHAFVVIKKADFRRDAAVGGSRTFVMPTGELFRNSPHCEWTDHNREVIIDGMRCDVIAVKTVEGLAILTVTVDHYETALFASFTEHENDTDNIAHLWSALEFVPSDRYFLSPPSATSTSLPIGVSQSAAGEPGELFRPPRA